jgi:SPP1 family predicted phage head-tail adaptor
MTSIGDLKYRIVFQEQAGVPDGAGGFTSVWQDIAADAEVAAAVYGLSGGEQLHHRQLQSTATHKMVIRYRADIMPGIRVLKEGVAYNILSALDRDGKQLFLEILAEIKTS